jgi:ketosteroid isomerase-like protein
MSEEKVELVRAAWEAWERRDMEALFALYDPAIVWDQSHYREALDFGGVHHGHDGVRQFFRRWLAPFEDFYAHAEEFIDAGDAVVVRGRQGGRGKASGAEVEMPTYWQVYRLRDARIARIEVYGDRDEALNAAGSAASCRSARSCA